MGCQNGRNAEDLVMVDFKKIETALFVTFKRIFDSACAFPHSNPL